MQETPRPSRRHPKAQHGLSVLLAPAPSAVPAPAPARGSVAAAALGQHPVQNQLPADRGWPPGSSCLTSPPFSPTAPRLPVRPLTPSQATSPDRVLQEARPHTLELRTPWGRRGNSPHGDHPLPDTLARTQGTTQLLRNAQAVRQCHTIGLSLHLHPGPRRWWVLGALTDKEACHEHPGPAGRHGPALGPELSWLPHSPCSPGAHGLRHHQGAPMKPSRATGGHSAQHQRSTQRHYPPLCGAQAAPAVAPAGAHTATAPAQVGPQHSTFPVGEL